MVVIPLFGIVSQKQSQRQLLGLSVQHITYNSFNRFLFFLIYRTVSLEKIQPFRKIFRHWAWPALAAMILLPILSSCTMVSKEMLPGMEYREYPKVEIIEYEDKDQLQADCVKIYKKTTWNYYGCSLIPLDPKQKCIIRIMKGDEKTKQQGKEYYRTGWAHGRTLIFQAFFRS